ncbi:MAG TPA: hypothetical protein VEA78_06570 [Acidimicrobiales bacterium]|nr:hypothetical protein [Acidimicrobiales bacterium]
MTALIGIVLSAVITGAVERSGIGLSKWTRVRVCIWSLGTAWSLVTFGSALARGYSNTSMAIVAAGPLWAGAGVLITMRIQLVLEREDDGVTIFGVACSDRGATGDNLLRVLGLAWCSVTIVLAFAPLRYAGAFETDPISSAIARVASLGTLDPLVQARTIDLDMCLTERGPDAASVQSVPCGHSHQSQVVAKVSTSGRCPAAGEFESRGLDLEVNATRPIDDVVYCLVRSSDPNRELKEKIVRLGELADGL